jgi:hypothetical protein
VLQVLRYETLKAGVGTEASSRSKDGKGSNRLEARSCFGECEKMADES